MDQSGRTYRQRIPQLSPRLKGLLLVALLGLLSATGRTARAGDLQFTAASSQGLRLVAATVPVLSDGMVPGSSALLRLHFDRQGSTAPIHVTITQDDKGSWGATSAPGQNVDEVDIAIPYDVFDSYYWRPAPGDHVIPPMRLHFRADSGDRSTVGTFVHRSWNFWTRPSSASGPICISAGVDRSAIWPFENMDTDDLARLANFAECLSHIRALYIPQNLPGAAWLDSSAITAWVQSGGILVLQRPGKDKWTRQGSGMILYSPGVPDQNALGRMTLITPRTQIRWNTGTAPSQGAWPGFDAPAAWVFITLAIYVVLVLPVNYLLLRRVSKREGAWVTIPLLAAAFGLLLGIICYASKGISTQAARVTLVEQIGPGVYSAMGYMSIFSPRAEHYNVKLPAGSLGEWRVAPNPLSPASLWSAGKMVIAEEGKNAGVTGLPVSQWCSGNVSYHFSPPITGVISGGASYTPRHGWRATVQNGTSLDLEDCRVWASGRFLPLPNLPAGQSAATKESTAAPASTKPNYRTGYFGYQQGYSPGGGGYPGAYAGGYSGSNSTDDSDVDSYNDSRADSTHTDKPWPNTFHGRIRDQELKWLGEYLSNATYRHGAYFVGWSSRPMQSATVDGVNHYEDETLIVTPLEIVAGEAGLVAPAGSMTISTQSGPTASGSTESGHSDRYAYAVVSLPSAVLSNPSATLWLNIGLNENGVHSSTTSTDTSDSSNAKTPQSGKLLPIVWNNREQRWLPLLRMKDGQVKSLTLKPIGDYATKLAPPGGGPWDPLLYLKCDNSGKPVSFSSITASLNDPTPLNPAAGTSIRREVP